MKKLYLEQVKELTKILSEWKPFEAPYSEFEPEASRILLNLDHAKSADDISRIVSEVFTEQFDESFNPDFCLSVAIKIWDTWNKNNWL